MDICLAEKQRISTSFPFIVMYHSRRLFDREKFSAGASITSLIAISVWNPELDLGIAPVDTLLITMIRFSFN